MRIKDKADELIIAFAYSDTNSFKVDAKTGKEYIKTLNEIRQILGSRLIVLKDEVDHFVAKNRKPVTILPHYATERLDPKLLAETISNSITKLCSARGYEFNKDVISKAYGETILDCVRSGAINLNRFLELTNPTTIETGLTDMDERGSASEKLVRESASNMKTFYKNGSPPINFKFPDENPK